MTGFKHNGIMISVENWSPIRKKPVLAVRFDGESHVYKVASFNDETTANWFCDIMAEFLGIKEEQANEPDSNLCRDL